MTKKILFVCALLSLAGIAQAESQGAGIDAVKELKCLVGSWHGKGQVSMGDQQAKVTASYTCAEASAGAGVKCSGEMTGVPGLERYVWDDLWGVDPADGRVHWFTVTNAGETHDHAGTLGKRGFVGSFNGTRDEKPFVEEVRFHFDSRAKMRVSSVGKVAGKAVEKVQLTFEKRGG